MIVDEDTFPDESEFARLNKNAVLRHRNQVIEECARVADSFANAMKRHIIRVIAVDIARAIRALKDKP